VGENNGEENDGDGDTTIDAGCNVADVVVGGDVVVGHTYVVGDTGGDHDGGGDIGGAVCVGGDVGVGGGDVGVGGGDVVFGNSDLGAGLGNVGVGAGSRGFGSSDTGDNRTAPYMPLARHPPDKQLVRVAPDPPPQWTWQVPQIAQPFIPAAQRYHPNASAIMVAQPFIPAVQSYQPNAPTIMVVPEYNPSTGSSKKRRAKQRGPDKQKRKRNCRRCKRYHGERAHECECQKGSSGETKCEYFDEHGTPK
jgi:hypothetical protein